MSVNTSAADQDIVNNRETAFAADPVSLTVPQTTVGQDCSFVEPHAAIVLLFGQRKLIGMKEQPYRPVDYLVGRVSEDVHNRVGRVQDLSIVREVWRSQRWISCCIVVVLTDHGW
jgi:predicted RNase H-like nuclease